MSPPRSAVDGRVAVAAPRCADAVAGRGLAVEAVGDATAVARRAVADRPGGRTPSAEPRRSRPVDGARARRHPDGRSIPARIPPDPRPACAVRRTRDHRPIPRPPGGTADPTMSRTVDLHADIGEVLLTEDADPAKVAELGAPHQRRLRGPATSPSCQRPQGLAAVHGRPHARDLAAAPDRPHGGLVLRRHDDRVVRAGPDHQGPVRRASPTRTSCSSRTSSTPGLTLNYLVRYLRGKNPASLRICTLLDKPARRLVDIPVDYIGFTIPDQFVVGYGLDYGELYRNLRFVGVLRPEVYTAASSR